MKIAVVAPSPVPFVIGGIENLVWSMCDYINHAHPCPWRVNSATTLPAGFWTSSPGSWSPMELWTGAHVPVAFSASPIGEVPPVLPVKG